MNYDSSNQRHGFDATHWSNVGRAASDLSEVRRPAMDELLKQYRPALVSRLVHRKGMDRDDAEDLVNGFILEKILERQLLKSADKEQGKFRTLLLTSLHHYSVDQFRKSQRQPPTELLDERQIPDEEATNAFDVSRAQLVLARSLSRMHDECREKDNQHIWGVFAWRILVPAMTDRPPLDYESLVERFGFESPEQASNALVSAKRHIKRVVCSVLEQFPDCEDLDAELASVHSILKSPGALDVNVVSQALPEFVAEMKRELDLDLDQQPSGSWATVLERSDDENEAWSMEDLASIWRHQLTQPVNCLLGSSATCNSMETGAPERDNEQAAPTLQNVLFDDDPSFETLERLKKLGRNRLKQKSNRLPGQIAWAIYIACIAAALPRWRNEITDLSDQELRTNLEMASTCSWLDSKTRSLAATGIEYVPKG
jgi:DNA-directed RNA polymerase specialized sigma24 family protein